MTNIHNPLKHYVLKTQKKTTVTFDMWGINNELTSFALIFPVFFDGIVTLFYKTINKSFCLHLSQQKIEYILAGKIHCNNFCVWMCVCAYQQLRFVR